MPGKMKYCMKQLPRRMKQNLRENEVATTMKWNAIEINARKNEISHETATTRKRMKQLPQWNEVEIEMENQQKWNIEWNTCHSWMKCHLKLLKREMKQRMKPSLERMKHYSETWNETDTMNEWNFISFPVVDQDFVWYSSVVHDVSGSYQSYK